MATTMRPRRRPEEFDRDRDFVARRHFRCSGWIFCPGDPFDKTLVSTRRLRQLFGARLIKFGADGAEKPKGGSRTPATTQRDAIRAVPIPEGWANLPWVAPKGEETLRSLAGRLSPEGTIISNKARALEIIGAEVVLRERGA